MSYNGMYLVGNYPNTEIFLQAAKIGLRYFDFIEVGLPFSDPIADGPILAAASQKALRNNVTTDAVLDTCKLLKHYITHTLGDRKKIYIMTYANKIFCKGIEHTFNAFVQAGVDGVILADVPFIESMQFARIAHMYGLEYVYFITPESTPHYIHSICSNASGFIYTISLRGTTGSTLQLDEETIRNILLAKQYSFVPVVVGFGIKNKHDITKALAIADGFIMGTALVEKLEEGIEQFTCFIEELFTI